MANSDKPENQPRRDSRLETFLREASAVIATEKGMTPAASSKIRAIADRLSLPHELYETALVQLQSSDAPIGELTRYEQSFVAYLEKEFAKLQGGGVLSISMEENAIGKAESRFNIPAHRADRLIDHQAKQSGVGRLARSAAKDYGRQMIAEQIGRSLTIDGATELRFYKLGRQWGLDKKQTKQAISDSLSSNRRRKKVERRKRLLKVVLGLLMLGVLIAGGFAVYHFLNRPVEVVVNDGESKIPSDKGDKTAKLDARIASGLAQVAPELTDAFASDVISERAQAYEQLTNQLCTNLFSTSVERKQAQDLLAEVYFTEKDDFAIQRVLEAIDSHFGDRQSSSVRVLESTYQANRLAALVYGYPKNESRFVERDSRRSRLAKVIAKRISVDMETRLFPDYIRSSEQSIASEQWNTLIQNSWTAPSRSAVLVEPLYELTKEKIGQPTLNQFRTRSLRSILESDRTRWKELKQPVLASIKNADEVQVMDWIEIFETGSVSFREFLGPVLVKKLKLQPVSSRLKDVEKSLAEVRANYRSRLLGAVLLRNQQIEQLLIKFSERENNPATKITPDLIAQAINLGNLSLELCRIIEDGKSRDELAYESLDRNLLEFQKRLRDVIFLEAGGKNAKSSVAVTATRSDLDTLDRVIERLKDLSDGNRALRISGVDQLGRIGKKIREISYQDAEVLATYLYSDLETAELLEAQRDTPAFSHWRNLLLAASDLIVDLDVDLDQALTISNLLADEQFEISSTNGWKEDLSWKLFLKVKESFESGGEDATSAASDWVRLRRQMMQRFRERTTLIGVNTADQTSAESPVELVKKILNSNLSLGGSVGAGGGLTQKYERSFELINSMTDNEVERVVLSSGLLIEKNILQWRLIRGAASTQAESVYANYQLQMKRDSDLGTKLFYSEAALARFWSIQRNYMIEQLMERN